MGKRKKDIDHRWVKNNNGSIAIVFSYQGTPYKFAPVRGGDFSDDQDRAIASNTARQIELSIKIGTFSGIEPWLPRHIEKTANLKGYTLEEAWQDYKIAKADKVSKASQKSLWLQVDRCLEYLRFEHLSAPLDLTKISLKTITRLLLKEYSIHVVSRTLEDLHAACNLALKRKTITSNPIAGYQDYLPPVVKSKRSKKCYSQDEVQIILKAFEDNHYRYFVEFLFLTGVRPQLAIALTWQDIKEDKIIFNKGFTNGEHTPGKTGRETHFPIYPQLGDLIKQIFLANHNNIFNLVFPSHKQDYINLRSFTKDTWKPTISRLLTAGKLSKYLPTYHCRHSTATFLAKARIPNSTIAALLDTSEKMLEKHYLDPQELTNVEIPNLLGR